MSRHTLRGRPWERARDAALRRAGRRCGNCGGTGRLEVHHKVPLSEGGAAYDVCNLVVLCRKCHLGEHPQGAPERREWRALVGR